MAKRPLAAWLLLRLQVTVVNNSGVELCRGVLLGRSTVLTAASCLHTERNVRDLLLIPGIPQN